MSYNLLMFSPYFFPESGPESIVSSKLALSLLNNELNIDIISRKIKRKRKKTYLRDWSKMWDPLAKHVYTVDSPSEPMLVKKIEQISKSSLLSLFITESRICRKELEVAQRLISKTDYDFILARLLPVAAAVPAYILSKKTGIPLIINLNDPSKGGRPYPYESRTGLAVYFERLFLRKAFNHADAVTFPSPRLKDFVLRYLNLSSNGKYYTIPHIAMKPDDSSTVDEPYEPKFKLCHAGTLGRKRNPECLFEALARFKKNVGEKGFDFIFIGSISEETESLIGKYDLGDVIRLIGFRSYEETSRILRASSVQVIVEAPCKEGIFLPSKFVDYLQNGKPILAASPKNGTLSDIISFYRCGAVADCTSSDDIYRSLCELHAAWENGTIAEKYSCEIALRDFSSGVLASYNELFEKYHAGSMPGRR